MGQNPYTVLQGNKGKSSSNRASGAKFVVRKVAAVDDKSSISSNKQSETQTPSSDEGKQQTTKLLLFYV